MTEHRYDEERLARLLRALPAAPEGWVRAAQELPRVRKELDGIVARAEVDVEFRRIVAADFAAALEAAGVEPDPRLVEELRSRLAGS